ncbi:PD-(D/E)XK nuclease family protein [Pectobacterium zantedeschiae]|uniref:PD-(D/E)XK nuclease superfamily protein n=1 Tax=Pectobacterium zantedeschiae TaxID=2034769 RepID=A0A9X8P5Z7_9GAMM|nr:PD-(D/E)XK nuclease family protein [Pectobacterium zantedeschiae]RYC38214.1 PD-(D/E)XK nuclease superfamily protein [Pectobacterium zantedeschiae]RYC44860.1 PD-(D/E)XK nuclease superfamily protein [Pectobacterium zantedeschiae]RYC50011.1 PD-(D/E)XK nuclease superfamily protein [Pectobacterium zantedeschiae]
MNRNIFPDDFLEQLSKITIKEIPEPNFFDVGGCGYLENPTSDLMVLFMGGHEKVTPWLLKALLKVLKVDVEGMDFSSLTAEREVVCKDGERIDILIRHDRFIIGIENKIISGINNPFDKYEERIKEYIDNNQDVYKCILKPSWNKSSVNNDWEIITYTELAEMAISLFGQDMINEPLSKWLIFYKELLSHLSALSEEKMSNLLNNEQSDFISENFGKLIKAKQLLDSFENDIYQEGRSVVAKILPDSNITKSINNWDEDYKALHFMPSVWGDGSTYMTLVYRPESNGDGIEFYVNSEINKNQYPDIAYLKEEVEKSIANNDFIPSASNEDYAVTLLKNGTHLSLSFWGPSKDKKGAMTLLHDMTVWVNEKIKSTL